MAFIYALHDPRTGEVRYIGQTQDPQKRLREHLSDRRRPIHAAWVDELKAIKLEPQMKILEECEDSQKRIRERFWMEHYREDGARLTNGEILSGPPEGVMKPVTVYLSQDEIDSLNQAAIEHGRSGLSAQIRWVIKQSL